MPEVSELAVGEIFADYYQIERKLKSGGMGAVYVARHTETGKRHALKLMHPDIVSDPTLRARFKQEAQIASLIDYPSHIVDVTHAGVDGATGAPFIVMELLVGEEIGEMVSKRGPFSIDDTVHYLHQTAKALDRAHAKGVVHRDLKPDNLFLVEREDEPPTIKILDFGIAKILSAAQTHATNAGGTPLYMAPEQLGKSAQIGSHTDVWALGLIAYTMLVGDTYWQDDTVAELYGEILGGEYEAPTVRAAKKGVTLPPAFDAWFARVVVRDPTKRIAKAGDAISELAKALGVDVSATRPSTVSNPSAFGASTSEGAFGASASAPEEKPFGASAAGGTLGSAVVAAATAVPKSAPASKASATQVSVDRGASAAAAPMVAAPMVAAASAGTTAPAVETVAAAPKSKAPLFAAIAVGAAVLVGGTYFLTRSPRKKDAAAASSAAGENKGSLREQLEALNKFVDRGDVDAQEHEVTRKEYGIYLRGMEESLRQNARPLDGWNTDDETSMKPVASITVQQATAFCSAVGGQLPTRQQWLDLLGDKKLGDGDGIAIDQGKDASLVEVKTSPGDVVEGLYDLLGNAHEWTSSIHEGNPIAMGGSVNVTLDDAKDLITDGDERAANADGIGSHLGFRCIRLE